MTDGPLRPDGSQDAQRYHLISSVSYFCHSAKNDTRWASVRVTMRTDAFYDTMPVVIRHAVFHPRFSRHFPENRTIGTDTTPGGIHEKPLDGISP